MREGTELLDPAERGRPAQPAGAADGVGDDPQSEGNRQHGKREAKSKAPVRRDLARHRPDAHERRHRRDHDEREVGGSPSGKARERKRQEEREPEHARAERNRDERCSEHACAADRRRQE